eukprot:PITA_32853
MVEEYNSIMVNDVWEVVSRPQDRSVVGSRWIYKIKYDADDSIEKYKARFVAKGYVQKEGIEYEETLTPVARYTSIRIVISLAAQMGWEIHQMDVKMAFLNGVIEEEVYIEQPEGFETHEKKSHVCRLKKALSGQKQAPRAWYARIDGYLQKTRFVKSDADPNLYYLVVENEPVTLVLYVDDLFLTGTSRLIEDYKKNLATKFDMKDLGRMHYFLGLEVWQQKGEIFLGQGRYATKIMKRFRMGDCRSMATPMITNWKKIDALEDKDLDPTLYRQLTGSLMYLVNTRPNICFIINTLSQFIVEPKRAHWAAAKQIGKEVQWIGKVTFGYCFNIGSGITSWCSRKQKSMALGSSEAKYMAASIASCEAIWLRKQLVNLFRRNMEATRIVCDNQSCIKLFENLVFHDRSKHIDIRCHFVKDCVQRGAVQLSYTPTGEQVADILT